MLNSKRRISKTALYFCVLEQFRSHWITLVLKGLVELFCEIIWGGCFEGCNTLTILPGLVDASELKFQGPLHGILISPWKGPSNLSTWSYAFVKSVKWDVLVTIGLGHYLHANFYISLLFLSGGAGGTADIFGALAKGNVVDLKLGRSNPPLRKELHLTCRKCGQQSAAAGSFGESLPAEYATLARAAPSRGDWVRRTGMPRHFSPMENTLTNATVWRALYSTVDVFLCAIPLPITAVDS